MTCNHNHQVQRDTQQAVNMLSGSITTRLQILEEQASRILGKLEELERLIPIEQHSYGIILRADPEVTPSIDTLYLFGKLEMWHYSRDHVLSAIKSFPIFPIATAQDGRNKFRILSIELICYTDIDLTESPAKSHYEVLEDGEISELVAT